MSSHWSAATEPRALHDIRLALPALRPAEARVAGVLLADPEAAVQATVADLATQADASQATVVRCIRAIGYAGLPELRLALAQELSRGALERERSNIAEGTINESDSLDEIISKLAFHEARSIEQTGRSIDRDALDRVAHAIADGRPVTVFGVGASGLAAADLLQKLERIGLRCQFNADAHVQLVHAAVAAPDAVAIGLSFSGETDDVHRALSLARERGAMTVAITSAPRSPVATVANEVLLSSARESHLRAAALASRMTQLAVVDFLFVRVAQLRLNDVAPALDHTRAAVTPRRLREEVAGSREAE